MGDTFTVLSIPTIVRRMRKVCVCNVCVTCGKHTISIEKCERFH